MTHLLRQQPDLQMLPKHMKPSLIQKKAKISKTLGSAASLRTFKKKLTASLGAHRKPRQSFSRSNQNLKKRHTAMASYTLNPAITRQSMANRLNISLKKNTRKMERFYLLKEKKNWWITERSKLLKQSTTEMKSKRKHTFKKKMWKS